MGKRLLVVEDDRDIADLIRLNLTDIGFDVESVADGTEGYNKAATGNYDFLILDIMLPGMDGLEICKKLRQNNVDVPILMLTAKAAEIDRVMGLESGADDYLTKPFSTTELQARVKARMRRREGAFSNGDGNPNLGKDILRAGEMSIDPNRRKVLIGKKEIYLTAKEFDLLFHFARHPGQVFKREQLLDSVWGYGFDGYDHTVNSHINRLRTKIEENPSQPRYIRTVWGVGYRFAEAGELE